MQEQDITVTNRETGEFVRRFAIRDGPLIPSNCFLDSGSGWESLRE
jgi:hypothetical protein